MKAPLTRLARIERFGQRDYGDTMPPRGLDAPPEMEQQIRELRLITHALEHRVTVLSATVERLEMLTYRLEGSLKC